MTRLTWTQTSPIHWELDTTDSYIVQVRMRAGGRSYEASVQVGVGVIGPYWRGKLDYIASSEQHAKRIARRMYDAVRGAA